MTIITSHIISIIVIVIIIIIIMMMIIIISSSSSIITSPLLPLPGPLPRAVFRDLSGSRGTTYIKDGQTYPKRFLPELNKTQ